MSVDRTVTDRQKRRLCVTLESEVLDGLEAEAEERGTTASLLAGMLLREHAVEVAFTNSTIDLCEQRVARSAYCDPPEHDA